MNVPVNGVHLHCTITGTGPNPILLIPGAAAPSHWAFSSQLKHFERSDSQYTAIAYDPRGYGYSHKAPRTFSVAPEHHLKTDARDAHELMKSLGYQKYYVVGWCDGGITAVHLAALYPESVRGIVLWGTRGYLDEYDIEVSESLRDVRKFNPKFKEAFEAVYGSETALQTVWDEFTDSVYATYKHSLENNGELLHKELSQVSCPTLIFHGSKDRFTRLSHAQYIKKSINGSQLCIVPDESHRIPDSVQLNWTIENFFNESTDTLMQ